MLRTFFVQIQILVGPLKFVSASFCNCTSAFNSCNVPTYLCVHMGAARVVTSVPPPLLVFCGPQSTFGSVFGDNVWVVVAVLSPLVYQETYNSRVALLVIHPAMDTVLCVV